MTQDEPTTIDQVNDFAKIDGASDVVNDLVAKRRARLPVVESPKANNTLVALPLADGRIEWETVKGLLGTVSRQWHGLLDKCYTSNVALARNELANGFLLTNFEWLVMIDGDTIFTPQDLVFLLDKNDYAVNAPYAKKDHNAQPVIRGLGFTRVHRSCLELLIDEKVVVAFAFEGKQMHDFFIQGATDSGGYLGEDSGFWYLLAQIGVHPRIELRTNLQHMGKFRYVIPEHHMTTLRERIAKLPK